MLDVTYSEAALNQMKALPVRDRKNLRDKIALFAADPGKAFGFVRKLKGRPERRIRHGQWRALVAADHDKGLLLVIEIGHRREVYR